LPVRHPSHRSPRYARYGEGLGLSAVDAKVPHEGIGASRGGDPPDTLFVQQAPYHAGIVGVFGEGFIDRRLGHDYCASRRYLAQEIDLRQKDGGRRVQHKLAMRHAYILLHL
jgi:hypothetical protein